MEGVAIMTKTEHVHDQKIYMDFVDIEKAFDSVPRKLI